VFASDRSGTFELYSARPEGSQLGQLTRNRAADTAPLFSPNGRRVAFVRSPRQFASELWVMNADGSGQRRLAARGDKPAWSPDSRRIAYVSGSYSGPLVIRSVDGRGEIVVRGSNLRPSWSPDGRSIAFSRESRELMVVGSDGRGLRRIRRNADALGWSRRGAVVLGTDRGIEVVGTNGRGARRLARAGGPIGSFAWSPDRRRFAFVDGRGRLRVASAAGGGVRDLTPKGTSWVHSLSWSPDGHWLAVERRANKAVHRELVVVAADGSGSRPLSAPVPFPWGSENQSPSWRPKGATGARLGRVPVAGLPSETASQSTFEAAAPGSIQGLAADGGRVALVISFPLKDRFPSTFHGCASVEVWEPAGSRVVRPQRPCGPNDEVSRLEGTHGVTLAGERVAWQTTGGGNTLETIVQTATVSHPAPVWLTDESSDADGGFGSFALPPVGDGDVLAFTVERRCSSGGEGDDACPRGRKTGTIVAANVWRVGGSGRCPAKPRAPGCTRVAGANGELTMLAADAERIVVRTNSGVRLLTAEGVTLRDFAVKAKSAALSGKHLAVRTVDAVEVYETDSGRQTLRVPVARSARLDDLEGEIVTIVSGAEVTLRRLGDGRTTTFRAVGAARAQLEPPGLFVAGSRRVTFTPMEDVLRRLGG
jgi:Tol biopolymer transport system component